MRAWLTAIVIVLVVACGLTHDVDGLSEEYAAATGATGGVAVVSGAETTVAQASSGETAVSSSTTGTCVEPVVPCGENNAPCCQCSPPCPHDYSHCNPSTGACEQCGWDGGDPCCNDETLDENKICEGLKRCVDGQCLRCCAKCTGDATILGPLDTGNDNNCSPTSGVVQTKCKAEKDCGMTGAAQCCPSNCVANSGWCAECTAALCSL